MPTAWGIQEIIAMTYTEYSYIGSNSWETYTPGIIDDVRSYNRALTEDELKQLVVTPLPAGFIFLLTGIGILSLGYKFKY